MEERWWFVLYVRSRAEKKLQTRLEKMGVESYLPLKTDFRKWSDRIKKVKVPLFPSYLFVHINALQIPIIYDIPEVVTFVKHAGDYAKVSEQEIGYIKRFEDSELLLEVGKESLEIGQKVEVISGPLSGMKGEVLERSGQARFMMRLDVLDQVIKVQLPAYQLQKISS